MEENSETYIIETVQFEEKVGNSEECIKITPLVVCSDDRNTSKYVTYCKKENNKSIKTNMVSPNIKTLRPFMKGKTTTNRSEEIIISNNAKPTIEKRKVVCYRRPPLMPEIKPNISELRYHKNLEIDSQIMIKPRQFKQQLIYSDDTLRSNEIAPCTKQQLDRILNGITVLFAHPAHKMPNSKLMQLYVSKCTYKKEPNIMVNDDMKLPPLISNQKKLNSKSTCENPMSPVKRIYGKRKSIDDSSIIVEKQKRTEEGLKSDQEEKETIIVDHMYTMREEPIKIEIKEEIDEEIDGETIYTITDEVQQEHFSDEQIVILKIDDDGKLTENNLQILLEAANARESNEIVAFGKNVSLHSDLGNIILIRPQNDEKVVESS